MKQKIEVILMSLYVLKSTTFLLNTVLIGDNITYGYCYNFIFIPFDS